MSVVRARSPPSSRRIGISWGFLVASAGSGGGEFDAAEDHGQLGGADDQLAGVGLWEGEGSLFESAEVEGEAILYCAPRPGRENGVGELDGLMITY